MNNQSLLSRISAFLVVSSLSIILVFLSSCGGGGGSTPDQNASGLYLNGTGTLDVAGGLTDITAFVYNNEIIVHSATAEILLKGTITSISGSAYTATVDVYKNGSIQELNVSVTGTVNNNSQITGTLQGNGVGTGNFAISYSSAFNKTVDLNMIRASAGVGSDWIGPSFSVVNQNLTIDYISTSTGAYGGDAGGGGSNECDIQNGQITIPDTSVNIYRMQQDFVNILGCSYSGNNFTGFASLSEDTTYDEWSGELLVAMANGSYAIFGTLRFFNP